MKLTLFEQNPESEYLPVLKKFRFTKKPSGAFFAKAGLGTIKIDKHGHWTHLGIGNGDDTHDFEGTTSATLDRHLTRELKLVEAPAMGHGPVLGKHMSKTGKAADVEQSDKEYIATKQWRANKPKNCTCSHAKHPARNCPVHGVNAAPVEEARKDDKIVLPIIKLRDPNQKTMAAKATSGAAGRHSDSDAKKQAKHGKRSDGKSMLKSFSFQEEIQEAWEAMLESVPALLEAKAKKLAEAHKPTMYQVKIETNSGGDWKDMTLYAASLQDIADSVESDDAHDKFNLGELTSIVEDWIGDGPGNGRFRGTWDEMDFDVKSLKDDVLKISWTFSGIDMSLAKINKGGTEVTRKGVISIMPAAPVNEGKKPTWKDSDAPDANGKFRDLGINDLADWLIRTRSSDMQKINGSLQQQIVFNRGKNPAYAAKMEKVREAVKRKLNKDKK